MQTRNLTSLFFLLVFACFITSCEDDDTTVTAEDEGRLTVEVTDAPVDDTDVSAVFVTFSELYLDGQRVEGFNKTTVELSALQNGRTETLISNADVAAEAYSTVEVVLDAESDATGSGPGCYVLTDDGQRVKLDVANNGRLTIKDAGLGVTQNATTRAVIDFDLRKALQRTNTESQPYRFAARSRLESSLRLIETERAGRIDGTVQGASSADGQIVIFAYAKGTYSSSEMMGDDNDRFLRAVTSTRVESDGDYTLAFLPAGDYELVAVKYDDNDNDGKVELEGRVNLSALVNIDLNSVSVAANSTTTLNLSLGL